MSQAHRNSHIADMGRLKFADRSTVVLCHFDNVLENDLDGEEFTTSSVTLNNYGYFGKCAAIESSTTNLITNGNLDSYVNVSYAWNTTLNGTVAPIGWSTYNSGVASPTVGYHAHLNRTKFDFPVLEFIDKNSQFGTALKHRWLGGSSQIAANASSLGWANGTYVTVSFDLMTDSIDKKVEFGIYHRNAANTASTFSSCYASAYVTVPYEWTRVEKTFQLVGSEWDFSQFATIYIYGHMASNDYEGCAWVTNVQVENKRYATSFTNSSRSAGLFSMPANKISDEEGTIFFRLRTKEGASYGDGTFTQNPVFSSGINTGAGIFDIIFGRTSLFRVTNSSGTMLSGSLPIPTDGWCSIGITWKRSETLKVFINGDKILDFPTPIDWTDAYANNASNFYIGGGIRGYANIMIDELRIDAEVRSDEEMLSWHISESPFFPRGLYRIAY